MKIIKSNVENIENETLLLYKLTRGKTNKSVSKLEDEDLTADYPIDAYLLYEDENNKGEPVTLLSILSGGVVLTAQSATFQKSFFECVDIVRGKPFAIRIVDGTTKGGRRYMDCDLASIG